MIKVLQRRKSNRFSKRKRLWLPYLFLIPAALLLAIFVAYPILNVFYYSFQNFNPAKPSQNGFAGLQNYIVLFTQDKAFVQSLLVSIQWIVTVVSMQFVFGLVFALILNSRFRGRALARAVSFAPWALNGVMIAILWSLIFNQNIGVLNDLLRRLGIMNQPIAWLANPSTAFWAVAVAELWGGVPFFAISVLAKLQSIPPELYESCEMDGANDWQKFRFITFPLIKDTVVLMTLLRAVWEFNAVDLILNLTGGGPMGLTTTLSIYLANQAIKTRNFGYGSAIGVVTFGIMLMFSIVYLKLTHYQEDME